MESIWITGKRFWKSIFYVWFTPRSSSRSSPLRTAKRTKINSTCYKVENYFRKRWQTKYRHNCDADICKKAIDYEFFRTAGFSAELYGWTAKTANIGAAIRQILWTTIILGVEDTIQKSSDYLFLFSFGGYDMDQRSGDGWFIGRIKVLAISLWKEFSKFRDAGRKDCFCSEQDHPESPIHEEGQSRGTASPEKGSVSTRKTDRFHDLRQLSSDWRSWCVCTSHLAHTHRGSSEESFIPSTCSCSCERFSSLCSLLLLHALPAALPPFPPALQVRRQPAHSAQREYGLVWRVPPLHDFKETAVEPYTELLDSPPLFSDKVSSADPDYDDAALEGMLREAHRVHSHHSPREDVSVSLSSSVSDRMERPVGDRTGRPVEQRNQEAQIRTLLDKQKERILAECQARINKYEFQAAYDRRSLLKLGAIVESQQEELHCARAEEVQ